MSPPSFLREIVITITYPARLGNHIFVSFAEMGRFAPRCAVKKAPAIVRGVRKTVNGAHRCRCAPFLYAIMTYGTVAGSLLGSPSGRAVTEGD